MIPCALRAAAHADHGSLVAALVWLLGGCVPDVGLPPSRLQAPRVLAVRSDPPEVAPGETSQLAVIIAGPGVDDDPRAATESLKDTRWALCTASKPPVDSNGVSDRCLQDDDARVPLPQTGSAVAVSIPLDACARFGPQTPPMQPGQPPGRPRDPDETGGYYQPVWAHIPAWGLTAMAAVRIVCGLAQATPAAARTYRLSYRRNRHPAIGALHAEHDGQPLPFSAVPAGASVRLRLTPAPPSAESFLRFDPATQTLGWIDERLRVSWFSAHGHFALATTGSVGSEPVEVMWSTPESSGPTWVWTVLRDNRGGVDVFAQHIDVVGGIH